MSGMYSLTCSSGSVYHFNRLYHHILRIEDRDGIRWVKITNYLGTFHTKQSVEEILSAWEGKPVVQEETNA